MFDWRRSVRVCATVGLALVTFATDQLWTQGRSDGRSLPTVIVNGLEAVDGEVLVRYWSQTGSIERQRAEFQIDSVEVESIGRRGARRMRSRRLGTRAMLQALRNNPDIEYVEPNYVIRLAAVPNDPSFGNLWGLFNTGQPINGSNGNAGADISAPEAWDYRTGSRANVVGVIDTGIDYTHPDLAANMWSAPRAFTVTLSGVTINCAAGTRGFNAITNTCNPMDDHSHGTHVAGTIGAVGNNGVGIAGVNWVASMMGLKFLSASGSGSTSNAIKAIEFAIQAKAVLGADANLRILSNSWGGGGSSVALSNQIEAAHSADMLFVAAAGNDATNNDLWPHYPSSYTNANVISVASSTNRDARSSFSNFGASSVDLAAPGSAILSTVPNNGYAYFSGTSMATPHVAGAAALVLSACQISTAALKDALLSTVDLVPALAGMTTTGGRLNVHAALRSCNQAVPTITAAFSGGTLSAAISNGPSYRTDWVGLFPSGANDSGSVQWMYLNGQRVAPSTGLATASVQFIRPPDGTYDVRLFANNGTVKLATSNSVTVASPPRLSINDISLTEGNSGSSMATFTVTLSPAQATQTVTVAYATANGSAMTGSSDYVATAGTLTFAPSVTTQSISVPVTGDTLYEPAETFVVNLSASGSAVISDAQGVATVLNDDAAPPVTLTISPAVNSGAAINVTITNGPANSTDWIALFPSTANDQSYVQWMYLNGQRTPPAAGLATASVQLTAPAVAGTYNVRMFANNGTTKIATSANVTVGSPQASTPTFTITPSVTPGAPITVTIADGPGNATDWVALFPSAGGDDSYLHWVYLNGQRTAPSSGATSASLTFMAPATAGTYNVRMFANNTLNKIGTSGTVTVAVSQPVVPALNVTPSVNPGGTIEVSVTNGPGSATDWIALFPSSGNHESYVNWTYLNGTRTAPASGMTTATVRFPAPAAAGTYNVRMFASNTLNVIATSGTVTVAQAVTPAITVTPSVGPGGTITVNVANGAGSATDWIALFPGSGNDESYVHWVYLNGSRTAPASAMTNATVQFVAPTTPGTYNVRMFTNNTLTKAATSGNVTVSP